MPVIVHTSSDLDKLREAGRIVSLVHKELKKLIVPGITTKYLDEVATEIIAMEGGKPAFKGYKGYPACICASANEQIVHGIPSSRELKHGDVLSIDVGTVKDNYFGDACFTVVVGDYICKEDKLLVDTTYECLNRAVKHCKEGVATGMLSNIIERTAAAKGFDVVKNLGGHFIGKKLHDSGPIILNYGDPASGVKLPIGSCLCLEPILVFADASNHRLSDGWTVVTDNPTLKAAHVEQQLIIHKDYAEVIAG